MKRSLLLVLLVLCASCGGGNGDAVPGTALITSAQIGGITLRHGQQIGNVPAGPAEIVLTFSREVSPRESGGVYFSGGDLEFSRGADQFTLVARPAAPLEYYNAYTLSIPVGNAFGVKLVEDYVFKFTTVYDPSPKFPTIPDEDLLTLVQRQTFKYFWDYAHPVCGLARERLGSDQTVTAGGSGFGIMCLPVGVERGFITRGQAAERLRTIVNFLGSKARRFHGAFPHWLDGSTGEVVPFSGRDNGADLVETAFLVEGLLAAAGYFDRPDEADIRSGIDAIWRAVEWDWFTRGGQDVLYWHWSPTGDWAMNMQVNGWNEAFIVYYLARLSPTHPVSESVYRNGWARGGAIRNGRKFYGITLPLGPDYGGPMFFAHYSFMGLNPWGLGDEFTDSYWDQNVAHALINCAYCEANPQKHAGYSAQCWGLTASDVPGGYAASSPTNDRGTIAPTAALSSMPYTPTQSIEALRTFYYVYGDRLWGEYGFYDAFCLDSAWFAKSYIAIDQGPIVVMIENYRTGLLWDCFHNYFNQ